MNDGNCFTGIIHGMLYTADNYGVKMFVFYYRNRLLDLLMSCIMKLFIILLLRRLEYLFNHFFL